MAAMKKKMQDSQKKTVDISISSPFYNKDKDTYVYIVIFGKPNKSFHMKPAHRSQVIQILHEKDAQRCG